MNRFVKENIVTKYILDHKRAVKFSFLVFIITFLLGLGFSIGIIKLFQGRIPFAINFIQTVPSEMLILILKTAVFFGLSLSLPTIVYYLAKQRFKKQEDRKQLILTLSGGFFLFFIGVFFAYWIIIPILLYILFGFNFNLAGININISSYISFCLLTVLISGIIFELPVIVFILRKMDLLKAEILLKYRKYAFITAFLLPVAVISNEIFEILFYSVTLLFFYFLIVFIAKIFK
ncbi:MAG: twin-arginine translocase subunit TatC [Candidatus Gastranaerophilales bacterium]|nr:twin-arginine translocase subunit TatC [Candidatus Gastranaerophilales bacterium]